MHKITAALGRITRVGSLATALMLGGCSPALLLSVHTDVSYPAPVNVGSSAMFPGSDPVSSAAARVVADADAGGQGYDKNESYGQQFQYLLNSEVPNSLAFERDAAELYKVAAASNDATVVSGGTSFARAAYALAQCRLHVNEIFAGWSAAGEDLNSSWATKERQDETNSLAARCDPLVADVRTAAADFSKTLAGKTGFSTRQTPRATKPLRIVVTGSVSEDKTTLLKSELERLANGSVLKESGGVLRVDVRSWQAGTGSGARIAVWATGFNFSSDTSDIDYDASFSAGSARMSGEGPSFPVLSSRDSEIAGIAAAQIVGAASDTFLKTTSGMQ